MKADIDAKEDRIVIKVGSSTITITESNIDIRGPGDVYVSGDIHIGVRDELLPKKKVLS